MIDMEKPEVCLNEVDNLEQQNPLVSIVVITYNSSKFVLETLESAKAQTYQNIELIVSDDCSTDDTVEICRNWIEENKDRFVRTELITVEKNTGITPNCNRGVKAAKGEWMKMIAGDDLLLNECIETNIHNLQASTYFYFSGMQVLSDNKPIKERVMKNFADRKRYFSGNQLDNLMKKGYFFPTPSFFFNRIELIKNDYFNEAYKFGEDLPLYFKLLQRGYSFKYIDTDTVIYRIHGESISIHSERIVNPLLLNSYSLFYKKEWLPERMRRKQYLLAWHDYLYNVLYRQLSVVFCNRRCWQNNILKTVILLSPLFYVQRFKRFIGNNFKNVSQIKKILTLQVIFEWQSSKDYFCIFVIHKIEAVRKKFKYDKSISNRSRRLYRLSLNRNAIGARLPSKSVILL